MEIYIYMDSFMVDFLIAMANLTSNLITGFGGITIVYGHFW